MAVKKQDVILFSPRGRVIWPHLITPQRDDKDKNDIYSIQLNFPKDEGTKFPKALNEMKQVLEDACRKKFGEDWEDEVDLPFKDGDVDKTYKKREFNRGHICLTLRSYNQQPGMGKVNKNGDIVDLEVHEQKDIYMGCFAVATYNFYLFEADKKSGISVGLRTVVKVADGEKLVTMGSIKGDWADKKLTEYASDMTGSDEDDDASGV